MTTQEQRAEWRALEQAATPGGWFYRSQCIYGGMVLACVIPIRDNSDADAAFIAAARTAVPALLADVDALTRERDALARIQAEWKREQDKQRPLFVKLSEAVTANATAFAALTAERDALAAENDNAKAALIAAAQLMREANARADALAAELARVRERVAKLEAYKQRIQDDAVAAAQQLIA